MAVKGGEVYKEGAFIRSITVYDFFEAYFMLYAYCYVTVILSYENVFLPLLSAR